jgi:subtilase family serine protease
MNLRWLLRRTALWVCVLAFSMTTTYGRTQELTQLPKGHVPAIVTEGKAQRLGAMPTSESLRLAIQLPLRNQEELHALIQRLYDPSSPDYHHYLSVEEFTKRYGPTAGDYQAVVEFATSHGFAVGAEPSNRLLVNITGTVAQIERTFHIKMGIYQHPWERRTFYSPDREPSLNLNVAVAHIFGLSDFSSVKEGWMHRVADASGSGAAGDATWNTGSGPGGSFLVGDLRAAYYGGTALTGSGQCVGLYELGGYDPADVTNSFDGVSYTVPVNNVLIDGASAGVTPGNDDIEQVMDIVAAIGMAPGLSQARVYIGPPNAWGDVNVINSMAAENQCKQLSSSYSWSNPNYVQDNGIFQEFAAQGQTFLNCTLDDGSYGTSFPFTYPQDDIWVTAVGGTDLITSGPGGSWVSESGWSQSGGGQSMNGFGIPDWQVPAINSSNGGSTSIRNVPDLSAEANTDNYLCYTSSGSQTCSPGWGGTSIATPRWAGFLALVNQQSVAQGMSTVGYLNPTLYTIGLSSNSSNVFHDITSGNNDCCG